MPSANRLHHAILGGFSAFGLVLGLACSSSDLAIQSQSRGGGEPSDPGRGTTTGTGGASEGAGGQGPWTEEGGRAAQAAGGERRGGAGGAGPTGSAGGNTNRGGSTGGAAAGGSKPGGTATGGNVSGGGVGGSTGGAAKGGGLAAGGSTSVREPPSSPVGRLTGVNWFGFETANYSPHGLWARDYKSMIRQIKDLGFNCVRIPWASDTLSAKPSGMQINAVGVDPYTKETGLNLELEGLSSLEIMDKILEECQKQGLKVILDNHSRAHDGYMNETLWYTSTQTEETWISDWVRLVQRYKDNSAVVAVDLKNEPHGDMNTGMKPPATWGYDQEGFGKTDWRGAAARCGKAVHEANSKLIIIVEGVQDYKGNGYWWGGNLAGVRDAPIREDEIPAANLWYSAHEYGPEVYNQTWFSAADFPGNLPAIWDEKFGFVMKEGIAPLFIGEFGIKEASASDTSSTAYKWFTKFLDYAGRQAHWTFWCMNPNSGDTEGVLKDDWVSVNAAKYNLLKPYLAAQ